MKNFLMNLWIFRKIRKEILWQRRFSKRIELEKIGFEYYRSGQDCDKYGDLIERKDEEIKQLTKIIDSL